MISCGHSISQGLKLKKALTHLVPFPSHRTAQESRVRWTSVEVGVISLLKDSGSFMNPVVRGKVRGRVRSGKVLSQIKEKCL